ncbi:uncharacterized protein FYW49_018088 [Xenentodon cancila]
MRQQQSRKERLENKDRNAAGRKADELIADRSLLIVTVVIFLTTTVSTAPLEETEHEVESEAAEEVEEELSEEEEDDDDSKSQDKIMGAPGPQQTITSATSAGGSASSGHSEGRAPQDGTAGSSAARLIMSYSAISILAMFNI